MKKIILIFIIALFSFNTTRACEICGCGLGNYYIGLLPQFNHKFIGLRYQYRRYKTVMADDPTQFSNDYYKTAELWGGWNIGKKWQILAILPYNVVHQVSDDGVTNNQGIGDIAMMVNYKVFDKTSTSRSFVQQLWIGAGLKLPTGKFDIDATDPALVSLANTQTGSASTDFMLNAIYNIQVNKWGINTGASYKLNTANKDDYTFGNKFSASSFVSYTLSKKSLAVVPNVGIMYEHSAPSKLNKDNIAQTGGDFLTTALGLDVRIKNFTVGANMQLPLSQNLSSGQTELKAKGMVHVTFAF